jgi:hypothetical protein
MNQKYIEADIINYFIEEEISEKVMENALKIVRNINNFLYLVVYINITRHKTVEIEFSKSDLEIDAFFLEIGKESVGYFTQGAFETYNDLITTEDLFDNSIKEINLDLFKTFHKEKLLIEKFKFINMKNLFN